ncbi:MAG: hypothetical protein ACREUU_04050 [Gammaproteobacteria bacterium]
MPVLTDEQFLNVDGFVFADPATRVAMRCGLRCDRFNDKPGDGQFLKHGTCVAA